MFHVEHSMKKWGFQRCLWCHSVITFLLKSLKYDIFGFLKVNFYITITDCSTWNIKNSLKLQQKNGLRGNVPRGTFTYYIIEAFVPRGTFDTTQQHQ